MAFGSDYGNSTFNQKQRKQLHEQFNIMGSNDNLLRMQITYGSSVFDTYSVPKLSKLVMKNSQNFRRNSPHFGIQSA